MVVGVIEEHLERGAVVDVGAGMKFEADDAAMVMRIVEQRPPAASEFLEGFVDETRRTLRPGIDHVPGKSARERGNVAQAKLRRSVDAFPHFAAAHSVRAAPRSPGGWNPAKPTS